jgi:ribonuclease Z
MKPVFYAAPVNGPFDDPCLYVRISRESRALLFDAGDISRFDIGNIMKISDIFITHMHIDHFIGFDSVLRAVLRREAPLRIYGPENIINCVEGKLRGYAWNLIRDYPTRIEVFEIKKESIAHAGFYAENTFVRIDNPAKRFDDVILDDPLFRVRALHVTHDVPALAYSMEEEYHININKDMLVERGLSAGPWLSELKKAIRSGASPDQTIEVDGMKRRLEELKSIATITRGEKISYVMDVSPVQENIDKLINFVSGSDVLFCEGYFLSADFDRAMERSHLTAALAGRIAHRALARRLELMHFSPKYRDRADELYREAEVEFRPGGIK